MDGSYFLYLVIGSMLAFTAALVAVTIQDAVRGRQRDS
jgi:hypothetical protein